MIYPQDFINKIIQGECSSVMKYLPDNCIDLTVTRCPYDSLRAYKGYTFNFQDIAKELYRVTKKGGVVVWIVGDATVKGSETGTCFEQALYFRSLGFNLHDTMIYQSDKPPLTHNRYEQKFEYMFILSKGKPKTFNPILEPCKYAGTNKNGRSFRHTGTNLSATHKKNPVAASKIKGNIWFYPAGHMKSTLDLFAFKHPAIFPEQLASDHIISWSDEEDIVLDPMCGSGNTLKMAKKLNRKYIGIEISKDYCDIAQERVNTI